MKLIPDCIRDILLTVEEKVDNNFLFINDEVYTEFSLLSKYTFEEINYHIQQIDMSGLISNIERYCGGGYLLGMLSPEGHEFVESVRAETNWTKTKEIATKLGSNSIGVLTSVASEVIASLIKGYFHIAP